MFKKQIIPIVMLLCLGIKAYAQTTNLPLIEINALEYEGAFIIPGTTYGESHGHYCSGIIDYNSTNNSLFFAGYKIDGGIAEFQVPTVVNSTNLSDLNYATILQNYRNVLADIPNPEGIDRVSGLKSYNGKLIVNAVQYYDAPADNILTTLVIEDASNIANSAVSGYYELEGAAHTAGSISHIPTNLQNLLGGEYITGSSSKYGINSRLAMGVSSFVFDPSLLTGSTTNTIPTTPLMDYDLADPLYADFTNYSDANYNILSHTSAPFYGHTAADIGAVVGNNTLWTEASQIGYAFIVPGTRTYMTIGSSGGHLSGMGYKAKQNNGNICGGPCAYDADDYYNYYWLWDVNDMIAVKNGQMQPSEVRPYAKGEFTAPFQTDAYSNTPEFHSIVGGSYDEYTGNLYLTIYDGGSIGAYSKNPVIAVYSLADALLSIDQPTVNLGQDTTICEGESLFLNITGQVDSIATVAWYKDGIEVVSFLNNTLIVTTPGLYTINITTESGLLIQDEISIEVINCECELPAIINYEINNCVYQFTGANENTLPSGYTTMGYLWDFGDGTTSNESNPIHIYESSGRYFVIVKHFLIDENGNCCTKENSIRVYVDVACGRPCGIIASFENSLTTPTLSSTQNYHSTSVISGQMEAYRWTLNNNTISTESTATIDNLTANETQTLCLTISTLDATNTCCQETVCQTITISETDIQSKISNPELDITLSPNPTTGIGELIINNFEGDKVYRLKLTDVSGHTFTTSTLKTPKTTLNLSTYKNGLYFIQVSDGTKTTVLKVIRKD